MDQYVATVEQEPDHLFWSADGPPVEAAIASSRGVLRCAAIGARLCSRARRLYLCIWVVRGDMCGSISIHE